MVLDRIGKEDIEYEDTPKEWCDMAVRAAADVIIEYCTENLDVAIGFNLFSIALCAPQEIIQIASDPNITRDAQITAIAEHEWIITKIRKLHQDISKIGNFTTTEEKSSIVAAELIVLLYSEDMVSSDNHNTR